MTVARFYLSDNENENMVIRSLYDGCPESKELVKGFEYKPSDVAVVFGVYKKQIPISQGRGRVIAKQQIRNLKTIVLETGYVNRGSGEDKHYAAGLNGLNGRADFKNKGMPYDRSSLLPPMKPWRGSGEHVILCGQVPWDAAVDFTNHVKWLIETAAVLQLLTKRSIVFRPHPLAKLPNLTDCIYSTKPLIEDLQNAHVCVTFNSNSGVESIINGIPVYAFDIGSMVYQVSNKLWTELECPRMPDRTQWYNDLAYTQWLPSEMAEGKTWKHLM
jgi:hypothetical protein